MHETERHRIILSAVQERPVVTVTDLCALTGASEATIRRDIAQLHVQKKLRRVRGGAEAIAPPSFVGINARPFAVNETIHAAEKRAIAKAAVELCDDGDAIIINGGTTTFQMVHPLTAKRLQLSAGSQVRAVPLSAKESKQRPLITSLASGWPGRARPSIRSIR